MLYGAESGCRVRPPICHGFTSNRGWKALVPPSRIYYSESKPDFQSLKTKMEEEWVPKLQKLLKIDTEALSILWDADFLFGPETNSGEETYTLCEINVSSVHPYPDSAVSRLVEKAVELL